jgi:uncharacterized protein with GYD domain
VRTSEEYRDVTDTLKARHVAAGDAGRKLQRLSRLTDQYARALKRKQAELQDSKRKLAEVRAVSITATAATKGEP